MTASLRNATTWGRAAIPGNAISALGVDVGPHAGMFAAWWHPEDFRLLWALAWECTHATAPGMLAMLLEYRGAPRIQRAQMEDFRQAPGGRGTRLRGVSAAQIQGQLQELYAVLRTAGTSVNLRAAGNVKPWAERGNRLGITGLATLAGTSKHVQDAAKHMLFTACHDGQLPDPLSDRAGLMRRMADHVPGPGLQGGGQDRTTATWTPAPAAHCGGEPWERPPSRCPHQAPPGYPPAS